MKGFLSFVVLGGLLLAVPARAQTSPIFYAGIEDGTVTNVIVASPDFVTGLPGQWVQYDPQTIGCVHVGTDGKPDNGKQLRCNAAGIGGTYDATDDVFYSKQPWPSWTLNHATWTWQPPTPEPTDGKAYRWDETTKTWNVVP